MRRLTIIILCLIIATAVAVGAAERRSNRDSKESRSNTPPSASTKAPATSRASSPSYSPQSPTSGITNPQTRYTPDKSRSTYTRTDTRPSVTTAPRTTTTRNDSVSRTNSYRPGTSTYQRPANPTGDRSEPAQVATRPSGVLSYYGSGGSRDSKIRDHGPDNISGDPKPVSSTYYQRPTTKPPVSNYTPDKPASRSDRPAPRDDRIAQKPDQSRPNDRRSYDNSSYRPHNPTTSTSSTRVYNDRNRRPTLGYRPALPRTTKYVVGYRPAAPYIPPTYRPPIYRTGFYYYPASYYDRPCYFAYWAPVYAPGFSYRSVYFSFGLFPYLRVSRISALSYTTISYVTAPIYIDNIYHRPTRYAYLDETLADIRSGWIAGRYDLVERHVRPDRMIAVLLDGQYDYSVSGEDYLAMTRDALGDIDTTTFVWSKVRERADGTLTAFGEHSFRSSGAIRTLYVTYTLQRVGDSYYITEVGSSENRLE
ncbi:MAG: hypothetical protein ACOX3G_05890 [Armatimonadota bacterium]|jgi:hypothetical protein